VKKQILLLLAALTLSLSACNISATRFMINVQQEVEIALGASQDIEVTISREDGFDAAVKFVLLSPSKQISGTFKPNPASANKSILTLKLDSELSPGKYTMAVRGEAEGQSSGQKFDLIATSAGTVSGYVLNKKGGEPVVGSTVKAGNSLFTSTTDENGYYQIFAPTGNASISFEKTGYATATVSGLKVEKNKNTSYNTLQLPVFDSTLPTTAPTLSLETKLNGDMLEFDIAAELSKKDVNGFTFADVSLGSQGGSSGYLNASAIHKRIFGLGSDGKASGSLPIKGFSGTVPVFAVVYDLNNNRAEVVKYVDLDAKEGTMPAKPTSFEAIAVTFGDVSVFGTMSVPTGLDANTIDAIFHSNSISEVQEIIANLESTESTLSTLSSDLDGAVRWVDLSFKYDEKAVKPDSFIVYRKIGNSTEELIGRVVPKKTPPKNGIYKYRDSNGIVSGIEYSYRVVAVNGKKEASTAAFSVTPLAPFYVEGVSPANNAVDVSVAPGYLMAFKGSAQYNVAKVIVLDRIHSSFKVPYESPLFVFKGKDGPFSPFKGMKGIPHGVLRDKDGYFIGKGPLAPFHAYDWQTAAMTINVDKNFNIVAMSVAADFFKLFRGVDFGAKDGPVNAFLTGDGSY